LSLLDQAIAHGGGRVAAAQVADMLGSLGGDIIWPLLERIVAGDGPGTIQEAARIASRSVSFDSALEEIAAILHRVALAQAGAEPSSDDADAARVTDMASRTDAARVQVMYQVALLGRRDLPLAPDEYAGFTMTMLRMLSFCQPDGTAERPSAGSARAKEPTAPARAATPGASKEAKPAPAQPQPATPSAAPKVAFDGNWPALVERLNLPGLAGMVARHGELVSFEQDHLELVVPETHRMYAEKAYTDKLRSELAAHFGPTLRLTVKVGGTSGSSVAAVRSREMAKKQASAAAAIEDDPFVRDLVRDLGAEVVTTSIRPTDDGATPNEKR
jgi:DNA polymerase III subunit gamma/tau